MLTEAHKANKVRQKSACNRARCDRGTAKLAGCGSYAARILIKGDSSTKSTTQTITERSCFQIPAAACRYHLSVFCRVNGRAESPVSLNNITGIPVCFISVFETYILGYKLLDYSMNIDISTGISNMLY